MFEKPRPRIPASGFITNRWASAGLRSRGGGTCFVATSSFRSALASASGSFDRNAPDSSAWYSRLRETAIWITAAEIGARTQAMSATSPPLFRSLPNHMAIRARKTIAAPIVAAIEDTRMSRFFTWDISWARTARSSRSSRIARMPFVTATFALFGFRPVANAFGCCISET